MTNEIKIRGGLQELPKDERDFSFGAIWGLPKLEELPQEYTLPELTILDQNGYDFCSSFSTVKQSQYQELIELDPFFQFAMAKKIEGNYETWGLNFRTIAKSFTKIGSIEKQNAPFGYDKTRDFLANWENYPPELLEKAKQHLKKSYMFIKGSEWFNAICQTIWQGRFKNQSASIGLMWCREYTNARNGIIQEQGTPFEGHAVNVMGWVIIEGEQFLKIQNSYGSNVGDRGFYYISREVINANKKYGGIVFTDMPQAEAEYYSKNGIKITDNWFIQLLKSIKSFIYGIIGIYAKRSL